MGTTTFFLSDSPLFNHSANWFVSCSFRIPITLLSHHQLTIGKGLRINENNIDRTHYYLVTKMVIAHKSCIKCHLFESNATFQTNPIMNTSTYLWIRSLSQILKNLHKCEVCLVNKQKKSKTQFAHWILLKVAMSIL